jgi:Helix-loop-helix DNA-binding domain
LAFTPLVSPAVTPLEAHFNIPEYTVPGAYFSPLSSPALHAQNEHRSVYDNRRGPTSASNSPNDVNVDATHTSSGAGSLAKKVTKKAATKPRIPRAVRQSPIVKPQKRKGAGSTVISQQTLADIVEPALQEQSQPQTQSSTRSRASTEGSDNDSISPEHLSDMNMAPPPLPTPGSAGRSPFLPGQNEYPRVQQVRAGNSMSPATPASLMKLAKADQTSPAISNLGDGDDQAMDGFSLPEPANPARPRPPRLVTQSDDQVTPTADSASSVTPSFQSLPSPAFTRPGAVGSASSPQLSSLGATSAPRKMPQLSVRGAKKRASVSSVQVSPALRPKISPSIKPLIRGGTTVNEDTASLLLASKSNYQNILEGTHLPGVSYPTELSTNLTSKRTSHKIAEQGRRNRINSALQEIAILLPRGCSKDSGTEKGGSGSGDAAEGRGGGGGGGGQSANSKASTVELAIEYIKQLKKEVADANRRADEAEKALELKVS